MEGTGIRSSVSRLELWQTCTAVCLSLLVSSCIPSSEYKRVHSRPEWKEEKHLSSVRKVSVLFTGNRRGVLDPVDEQIPTPLPDKVKDNKYMQVGGVDALQAYLNIFKEKHQDNYVLIDIGYVFDSNTNLSKAKQLVNIYDKLAYDAIGLNGHELVYFYKNRNSFNSVKTTLISTNTVDLTTGDRLNEAPITPYKIINRNDVTIGIVSMSSLNSMAGEDRKRLSGVYFEDPVASFLKVNNMFKKQNVDIVILVSHVHSHCQTNLLKGPLKGRSREKNQIKCLDGYKGLAKLVKRLPPNSIDLIISGDNKLSMGYIGNIPIVQIKGNGKYLGVIDMYVDIENRVVLKENTTIYPPTKLCHQFFASTHDCFIETENNKIKEKRLNAMKNTAFQTMPAKFLGHEVKIPPLNQRHISTFLESQ